MNDTQVGERLRILRAWKQVTQAEVAKVLGIQQNGISEIEKGERPLTIARASRLCEYFDVPPAWFFEETVPLPVTSLTSRKTRSSRGGGVSSRSRRKGAFLRTQDNVVAFDRFARLAVVSSTRPSLNGHIRHVSTVVGRPPQTQVR